ncbi:MAG: N-formylglutamate amidohydrolase [Rhodobacteraceae bacterium]|nr:N-formylglutamate amidohydrolase [Paracoccaceae bacterium]
MTRPPYILAMPDSRSTATIFASPHSGCDYPRRFVSDSVLTETTLRSSEDAFVDRLFDRAPQFGAPLLTAVMPRAYVDLNRSAEELDPALIEGVRQFGHNPRISSGLGVVPRVVSNGKSIRHGRISMQEARERLDRFYHPYHDCLHRLMGESHAMFGSALLFDCHSMPKDALLATSNAFVKTPDIVLGDRFGTSCDAGIAALVEGVFKDAGLVVSRNLPFAGAFVVQNYGRPSMGRHVMQIEINRALYMDEATITPNAGFGDLKAVIDRIVAHLADLGRDELKLAAE